MQPTGALCSAGRRGYCSKRDTTPPPAGGYRGLVSFLGFFDQVLPSDCIDSALVSLAFTYSMLEGALGISDITPSNYERGFAEVSWGIPLVNYLPVTKGEWTQWPRKAFPALHSHEWA